MLLLLLLVLFKHFRSFRNGILGGALWWQALLFEVAGFAAAKMKRQHGEINKIFPATYFQLILENTHVHTHTHTHTTIQGILKNKQTPRKANITPSINMRINVAQQQCCSMLAMVVGGWAINSWI